jgi:hypothetical protein
LLPVKIGRFPIPNAEPKKICEMSELEGWKYMKTKRNAKEDATTAIG